MTDRKESAFTLNLRAGMRTQLLAFCATAMPHRPHCVTPDLYIHQSCLCAPYSHPLSWLNMQTWSSPGKFPSRMCSYLGFKKPTMLLKAEPQTTGKASLDIKHPWISLIRRPEKVSSLPKITYKFWSRSRTKSLRSGMQIQQTQDIRVQTGPFGHSATPQNDPAIVPLISSRKCLLSICLPC